MRLKTWDASTPPAAATRSWAGPCAPAAPRPAPARWASPSAPACAAPRGLRREELATLAGISIDYYVRLERGKEVRPSPTVLDALARTLRLDDQEHQHLRELAVRAARYASEPPPTAPPWSNRPPVTWVPAPTPP
ncbi:helix-turn-helix domain-containing protein [Streptosporangium sp. G11]|uniref:helix-turn-helix domain-containing protein n=1 Tax=Streptosporangium sp. G11 TaxID=3436926 RepID=UPI003EBE258C